ncbi:MAG: ATP-binding cassette domain-containing protein [Candidatus Heimdallarchaeota archaeon]|nr:ATP-binding cassette domain-containing protein [Candidatus Heimdallarchaeota archaeon]
MTEKIRTLKVSELTKIFPHPSKEETNYPLFAGTSLEINSQKPNFITGVSGSGKTTLFRIIASLEPINAGEIFLDDIAIHKLKGKEKIDYLQTIGLMDQFPSKYLSLNLTVKQNLEYTLALYASISKEETEKRIEEISVALDLKELLNKKTILLSGGELRRVGLASNIIHKPKLLLCDEPSAQLDKINKEKVISAIEKLNKLFNTLILIATHDLSIISKNPMYKISERRIEKCQ